MESKLMCPLGDEMEVSKEVIDFLEKHHYIDVIKAGEYLFTLRRLKKGET